MVSLPGQPTQPRPLAWHLTFKVKCKVKGWCTGYRQDIASAREPKWSQMTASVPGKLTQISPLNLYSALKVEFEIKRTFKSKDGLPDIVPKLRQHVYQNGLKRQLALLGSLHNHDLSPGI